MTDSLVRFSRIVRSLAAEQVRSEVAVEGEHGDDGARAHPFETRNIHPDLPPRVRRLYDDGHWETSVFEAFKFVEKEVKRVSGLSGKTGYALMMAAFNEDNASIKLNNLTTESEIDEQRGYKHMFAGSSAGIRNPRGHEVDLGDTPDEALDYLALASILLRKLDAADLR